MRLRPPSFGLFYEESPTGRMTRVRQGWDRPLGKPYVQKHLFAIVRLRYGDMPLDDRDDFDEELARKLKVVAADYPGATVKLLDEHGVAEFVQELVRKGLQA